MTLDITKLAPQVGDMVEKINHNSRELRQHLELACAKLLDSSVNVESLKRKIADARTPNWSAAGLHEGLSERFAAPPIPPEYTALATDGSHIAFDRHRAAHCYLINIGAVMLHYGANPEAQLDSFPKVYAAENELVIRCETNKHKERAVEGALLDARRSVEEVRRLAEMAAGRTDACLTVALMDGSLVLFGLQNYDAYITEQIVDKEFLPALDKLEKTKDLALTSYISLPRSMDVVNALRIAVCPHARVDCDVSCSGSDAPCDAIAGTNDRLLFGNVLQPGERSALFTNPSSIVKRYRQHQVHFFYLRSEEEIGRVQVPEWVVRDRALVDLTHALVLDQCRRGQGYPVALSEAHEQAVVGGADRERFWALVEDSLAEARIGTVSSGKSRSKRTRWL